MEEKIKTESNIELSDYKNDMKALLGDMEQGYYDVTAELARLMFILYSKEYRESLLVNRLPDQKQGVLQIIGELEKKYPHYVNLMKQVEDDEANLSKSWDEIK
ncbi:MAG TPA: hypothetical protein VFW11_20645 [Cyclobacteriaceae bacterium]|nr:hypothetical protein [Cyclobacteriaceae bacterium]